MKLIKWILIYAVAATAPLLSVGAMTLTNHAENPAVILNVPASNLPETIERGGTITAIDPRGKTLSVDQVVYPLAGSLKVYAAEGGAMGQRLKKNGLIRFKTVKDRTSGQEKIIGIWMTNSGSKPSQK